VEKKGNVAHVTHLYFLLLVVKRTSALDPPSTPTPTLTQTHTHLRGAPELVDFDKVPSSLVLSGSLAS
jgi:hypothetical protein